MANLVMARARAMVRAMVLVGTTTTKRMIMSHPVWQKRGPVPAGSHCGPVASKVASEVAAGHACVYARLTV